MKRSIKPATRGDIMRERLAVAAERYAYAKTREYIARTLGGCLMWLAAVFLLAAVTGCANFRAAGTFQYVGDNMRAECTPESGNAAK